MGRQERHEYWLMQPGRDKGEYGERLARWYCKLKHWRIVWQGDTKDSHDVDFLLEDQAGKQFYLEVKCHDARDKYPDNGMNENAYDKYCQLDKPVMILFIDMKNKKAYYNWLDEIRNNNMVIEIAGRTIKYPWYVTYAMKEVFFPLVWFKDLFYLFDCRFTQHMKMNINQDKLIISKK